MGEEGADAVIAKNLRMMDQLFQRLEVCCANELCRYPISALRQERFAVPGLGDVCATCHGMHQAISFMNPQLEDGAYFKLAHEAWKKEQDEWKKKRKRMDD